MQQLTKSLGSFGWAISLFGVQQALNLFRPVSRESGMHPTTTAFQALTEATVSQLGATTQRTFLAVDGLQRRFLDMGFSLLGPAMPARDGSASFWSDTVQRAASRAQTWSNSV